MNLTRHDPGLDLWMDTAAKHAIVEFVERVTTPGSRNFLPEDARVAVFDNDGTLWCEKPMPVEVGFILERLALAAHENPSLRPTQPWKAAFERDYGWLGQVIVKHYNGDDSDVKVLMAGILHAFRGMSVEAYTKLSGDYLGVTQNPVLHLPIRETAYAPMLGLLRYLEHHGFTNYIASGGDRDFMRPISYELYGVPSERVIGSSSALRYESDDFGGRVTYLAQPDVFDDGPAKPVRIWSRIGRVPVLACGNANGDIEMLQYVARPGRNALSLVVNHDDDARDIAYTAGAERLLEEASNRGWTVISIAEDWRHVFNDKAQEETLSRAA